MLNRKLVGALAGAVLALAGMASTASALTVTISNPNAGDAFSASVTALNLTASIGTVRCNVVLNGSIPDATLPVTGTGISVGTITSGSVSGCSPAVTVRLNNFPWSITADAATVLAGGGQYQININRPDFTLLGVNFIAASLAAQTNGTSLTLNQPATVRNAANSALTGNLGAQSWGIGPSPISITG